MRFVRRRASKRGKGQGARSNRPSPLIPYPFQAAALLAAAFLFLLISRPDRRIDLPQPSWQERPTAAGAFHIHTNRSDGSGSPEDVAAAAMRAGLQFIILTDHGDGTRQPDPPQYRSGVLCIDAVEISTSGGHYIAIGLGQTPFPLGGEARGVIEDVARWGGFGVVAHPDSNKPSLQWHEWDAPFEAMEWLNADTEWRDESRGHLARALAGYPLRPVETLGSLLDRPDNTLARWDALTGRRRVVALAGADAHARIAWRDDEASGYRRGWFVRMPSYDASFRMFALRVNLERPLSGRAGADAEQLMSALKAGHVYTGIDAIASPVALEFTASSADPGAFGAQAGPDLRADGGQQTAAQGDVLHTEDPVTFRARVNAPTGGVIVLRKDGRILTQHPVPALAFESTAGNGAYRVEVYLSNAAGQPMIPWIVSNPIYVQPAGWGAPAPAKHSIATDSWGIQGGPWHVEKDAGSSGQVTAQDPPNGPVEFSYRLAGGTRAGQYAALGLATGNALRGHSRISFRARGSRPMRISVQARRPAAGERWQRSVYLDEQPRDIIIPFSEMRPVAPNSAPRFDPSQIDTLLFVADTANTRPDSEGSFVLTGLNVEH